MSNMVFCSGCGKEIHSTAKSCPHCGAVRYGSQGSKSRIAAALLAFFLGSFGVHKFYLGKIGQGILYLIFCWTLIPSIIAFVEFIIYLCESDETFDRKYNS
ncbi:zinc-ribbon domain and TM2 domain-containing protein [Rahnella sp. SAP-1]|uniref:Zinc-ribbon domain and TM2 domain-containing protein n=1 Tax=Rouxiella aceris TaxID=2703884 RepID=A0A848MIC6_9GAMM|nr:zinc-ribbon domain and TM2 domain-containing protein [Rouxiella aceris]NMP26830.1 zinc-ribbon domain and TM2 domain-containing protein [Rouxiella aceris]